MKVSKVLSGGLNVAVLAILIVVSIGPNGWATTTVKEYWARHKVRRTIATEWSHMVSRGSRIDANRGEVQFIEFVDYQCPYCRLAHTTVMQLLRQRDDVGAVMMHLPLSIHPKAEAAARASICAEVQGSFTTMHQLLFTDTSWEEKDDWRAVGEAAYVPDIGRFIDCLGSDETAARLEADQGFARQLGVTGTPSFVHHDGIVSGVMSLDQLESTLGR